MNFSVRRRRRGAAALLALTLPVFAACEDPAVFTEPEESTFTAVAINRATVLPHEGSRLTAGPTPYDVEVEIAWQNMPAGSELAVYLETHDSVTGQNFRWEGDIAAATETLSGSDGETTFEGQFTLPVVSPFCGSYDYLRILAVVFPGGEAPPNAAYRDEVFYEVSGADWSGPCLSDVYPVFPGTNYRVGEPILVYGRDLPDDLDVSLPGALQSDNVWSSFIRVPEGISLLPVPGDGYSIAFVPIGATSGRVRAFADGSEVRYGPDGDVNLIVAASQADVFEPNNSAAQATDSIFFNLWDPFAFWGPYGYNPSLTLTGADLTPDAVAPIYGQGDWFYLYQPFVDAGVEIDMCVNVTSHDGLDDIDVIVYDENGLIVDESASAGGDEAVRVDDVSNDDFYFVWVAPFLAGMTSTNGGYTYEVGFCGTGSAVTRPDGPLGFKPTVGGSSGNAPRAAAGQPVPAIRQPSLRGGAR